MEIFRQFHIRKQTAQDASYLEVVEGTSVVVLMPRGRRFGKEKWKTRVTLIVRKRNDRKRKTDVGQSNVKLSLLALPCSRVSLVQGGGTAYCVVDGLKLAWHVEWSVF